MLTQPLLEGFELWRGRGRAIKEETDPGNLPRLLRLDAERCGDDEGEGGEEYANHRISAQTR